MDMDMYTLSPNPQRVSTSATPPRPTGRPRSVEKATTDKWKPSLIDYGASTASAYGIRRECSSYLQVGYRGVRRGYGAPLCSRGAWGGWEQAGADLSKLGVDDKEARVGSLDAVRRASSCTGVGDEIDWSGVRACAYTVVRGFLTV